MSVRSFSQSSSPTVAARTTADLRPRPARTKSPKRPRNAASRLRYGATLAFAQIFPSRSTARMTRRTGRVPIVRVQDAHKGGDNHDRIFAARLAPDRCRTLQPAALGAASSHDAPNRHDRVGNDGGGRLVCAGFLRGPFGPVCHRSSKHRIGGRNIGAQIALSAGHEISGRPPGVVRH